LAVRCGLSKGLPMQYYPYEPQCVLGNSSYKLYYDRSVVADLVIYYSRPGIVMLDKTTKEVYIIGVAIPDSYSLHSIITKKLQNYTDLK
jgi:hypothetical protein